MILHKSSNQIKSNQITFYCHITTAHVPWWVTFLRACSRQCRNNLHIDSTYLQTYTEDNVRNTKKKAIPQSASEGSDAAETSSWGQQREQTVGRVAGFLDDPPGFPYTPPGVGREAHLHQCGGQFARPFAELCGCQRCCFQTRRWCSAMVDFWGGDFLKNELTTETERERLKMSVKKPS